MGDRRRLLWVPGQPGQHRETLFGKKTNPTSLKQNKTQKGGEDMFGLLVFLHTWEKLDLTHRWARGLKSATPLRFNIQLKGWDGINASSAFMPPGPLLHGLLIHTHKSILAPSLHAQPLNKPETLQWRHHKSQSTPPNFQLVQRNQVTKCQK